MKTFRYVGGVPASKSIYNRVLIAKSFFPSLEIIGETQAEDVLLMKDALDGLSQKAREFHCGLAGTVLRFLALRVSRESGDFTLRGMPRLFERPQMGLLKILWQLGVEAKIDGASLKIRSHGWKPQGDAIHVPTENSSQFASAILLSAWRLPQPIFLAFGRDFVSRDYFKMTQVIQEQLGMKTENMKGDVRILARQECLANQVIVEPDMSSAFAIAAAAAIAGEARLTGLSLNSLQPDRMFIDVLTTMGATVRWQDGQLVIQKAQRLKAIKIDLKNAPDLLPVLAIVASFAEGSTELTGVAHANLKESRRIQKVAELLRKSGVAVVENPDGLTIEGHPSRPIEKIAFDSDHDHRLAMAAGMLSVGGFEIELADPHSVKKSFPQFWQIMAASL